MKTIAIANHKGGVGKSGAAVCLAGALRERGLRVLVVDLDQQATATEWLGLRSPGELPDDEPYGSALCQAVSHAWPLADLVRTSPVELDVVPCGSGFASFDRCVSGQLAAERLLARSMSQLPEEWDLVLLDCPPSLGLVTVNALVASDYLLIPVEPKSASRTPILTILRLAQDVQAQLNENLELLGIVVSRMQPRLQHRQVESWLRELFGVDVLDGVIRESTHVGESHAFQRPVNQYMPASIGAVDFREVGAELLSRIAAAQEEGRREVRIYAS
ncbi:MAG: ParA family protein [bacterium]|nr:ParA family protein [bacterium]